MGGAKPQVGLALLSCQSRQHHIQDFIYELVREFVAAYQEPKINGPIQDVENCVWRKFAANLSTIHGLAQNSFGFDSAWLNPAPSESCEHLRLRLSRSNYRRQHRSYFSGKYAGQADHLCSKRISNRN